jgi:cytolysin-activating lysine-acyltransferase
MGIGQREEFVRTALRHFAELRRPIAQQGNSAQPFPADWFNLPPDVLADFGAMFYLSSMIPFHRSRSLADAVSTLEPALRLGQYHILRSGGFARAFFTWAGLDRDSEHRLAIDHLPIRPEDWNSGPSIWMIDFVAPFGHFDQIVPKLTANPNLTRLRTLRHNRAGGSLRVHEWTRPEPAGKVSQKSYSIAQFRDHLAGG